MHFNAGNLQLLGRAVSIMALLMGAVFIALHVGDPMYAEAMQPTIDVDVQRPMRLIMSVKVGEGVKKNKFTCNGNYVVENDKGDIYLKFQKHMWVTIEYKNGKYTAHRGNESVTSSRPLRVTPVRRNKICKAIKLENRPAWNPELNDNMYYGSIELVYSKNSKQQLIVNHVPIERYVSGIAEVGNSTQRPVQKAILVAARTYAKYNLKYPTKHADEPYILDATENDQVYKGAGFTLRSPRVKLAQRKTRGEVIVYKGAVIVAPYFSQSDGRTRAWSEVWNGSYEWSKSVNDPGCRGMSMLGHGVGMSGEGARYYASNGQGYKRILRHYYKGIKIVDAY